jgi:hypothetical protein
MVIVSLIILFPSTTTNNDNYKNEDNPNRIIIKSSEHKNEINNSANNPQTNVAVPSTNFKPQVQPLPVPDTNSPIIVNTL